MFKKYVFLIHKKWELCFYCRLYHAEEYIPLIYSLNNNNNKCLYLYNRDFKK